MENNEFIKKGVIQEEQEGAVIKTASDELVEPAVEKPVKCCGRCNCGKVQSKEEN